MPTTGVAPPQDGVGLSDVLADATPAFARKPIPVTPQTSSSHRLLLALADATPAFVPDFDAPRRIGRRPWYRHPVALMSALAIALGIPTAALMVLPRNATPITGTTSTSTPTSTPATSPEATPSPATTSAEAPPPTETATATATATATVTTTVPSPTITDTVTETQTTTVTTTVPSPTITTTVPTTVTTTVTTTETGPAVTVTNCADGTAATSPETCPTISHPSVH
jgi:hypothetical protein